MTDDLTMLETQQHAHELISQQAPLERTLATIAHWISEEPHAAKGEYRHQAHG
jgi:hypothetical protein